MDGFNRICTGIDIVSISRVRRASGHRRFITRLFTGSEIEYLSCRRAPYTLYAKLFAAKEAAAKALGTGIGRGFGFNDIEVVLSDMDNVPGLKFYNRAAEALAGRRAFLTYSSSGDITVAKVVIE